MTSSFEILGLSPAGLPTPALATAMARAGGAGLLNLEFCADTAAATAQFQRLLQEGGRGRVGLRLTAAQAELGKSLLARAGDRALTLVLGGPAAGLVHLAKAIGARKQDRVLAEISDASALPELGNRFQGLVVRGHESGGWVGEYTSYILLQKLGERSKLPLFVQGGIGVHSAAACRAAGAAGVVLDDQLLLLAESPLPPQQQAEFARLNGAETKLFGELVDQSCRVYARPGSAALKQAEEDNRQVEGALLTLEQWRERITGQIGWAGDGSQLIPLGQGIGLAATFRDRFRTVAKLVQAIRRSSLKHIEQAAQLRFLDAGGPLAESHGTRYPLAQGPMTRVSDSPEFAVDVAKGGALPFLALALMRGPQVKEMLEKTRDLAGNLPWGVGMLGFIPHALREEQCAEIWNCKPPYALIAGGRPDQAAEFEKRGIKTYIHAPAPALLKMYLEQGARRFVFEGRECGGHIGPLSSFVLWEEMIDVLLEHVKPGEEKDVHVLFAGGIHDARSGAMVAAMTSPLAARGMKVGALMGTAYLFSQEIVRSGAIVEGFQEQAVACERTRNLETGPGHSTRCAATQFADDFFNQRRELIREGKSAEEIRDILEDLNLGRLRVASKGVNRDESGKVVSVAPDKQLADGMYMIGQVATLRDAAVSIADLHQDVCQGSHVLLEKAAPVPSVAKPVEKPSDIAIVGIGVVLPKANDANEYWNNVLHKVSVIREAPESRWDWKLFFDENRKTRDKIYSRWGGFLEEIHFDPTRFGIPPRSMKSIDPMQLLTLEAASRALDDAGYSKGGFDRESTSVILGSSGGAGELGLQYGVRAELPRFVENLTDDVWERLPEWTEESFAGVLPNVAAGRVANRMDFGGVNLTVDAACASSLAAISMAVNELESGRSSLVLAGGFDTTQSAYGFTTFAKTQALSPSGKPKTFDENADGIAISEGVVITVLKRLADAERDGDRIYAVIKSTAGSSDGKALGLTAPRSEGQVRALHRAYAKAGFSPATLGLIEAHGTGTAVGDRAEAATITRALAAEEAAPRSVALGSVKTLLGHTKAAAGVAGMVKVALALHHRVLPAHVGVEKPIDTLADPNSAAYLLKDPRPWVAHAEHPRRAAASAFGFGGTNFHAVLEEYSPHGGIAGAQRWPVELCLFRAADKAALVKELETLRPRLEAGSRVGLSELAFTLAKQAESRSGGTALAIVATDLSNLAKDIDAALAHLREGKPLTPSIRYNAALPATAPSLAFLFPGQGAQHLNMGREVALFVDELREAMEFADRELQAALPQALSSRILPPAAFDDATETAQTRALTDTRVAQPAIGTLSMGYLRLAKRLGLEATAAAGHSYGEYTALLAAGTITEAEFLHLSAVRGRAMAEASSTSEPGGMAAVQGRREMVAAQITEYAGVTIANHNAPEQCVISGPRAQVEAAAQKLGAAGLRATLLPVSGAFHTPLVASAKAALSAAIRATKFAAPQLTVFSNQTAKPYPAKPTAMQALLDEHMLSSVEFVAEVEAMHAAGSRVFLELGPKGICSNMAKQTLAGKDAQAIALDGNGGGLRGLLLGLAELFAAGVAWQPSALFANRDLALLDNTQLADLSKPRVVPKHMWLLSGGCARPIDDPLMRTGSQPALTQASSAAARQAQLDKIAASLPRPAPVVVHQPVAGAPMAMPSMPAAPALGNEALVAYQQTMRQFLSLQERVVQQFLGGGAPGAMPSMPAMPAPMPLTLPQMSAMPVAAAPVAPAQPTAMPVPRALPVAAAPVATPAAVPSFDAREALLAIVAERTGYPTDMLGMDADLEADLGIDSIKRVEILGALQKALPGQTGAQMQAVMERFTKAKTLNAILAQVQPLLPTQGAQVSVQMVSAPVAAVDYTALLTSIVAERTGYPTEMLGMDADLEADLGIDSIKRVEILGALQQSLPADTGAQMQGSMERYTKAKTLSAILAELQRLAPSAAVAAPAATVTVAVAAPAAAVDYTALLTSIVAERTGYPTEMLGMDADLEADLGIDSIKRVEILGALQQSLPADAGAQMQGSMERYTKAKTLSAILAELRRLVPAAVPAATVTVAVAAPVAAAPAIDTTALLTSIVAERTGYPTEMLGMQADLEADLGIDSIKRVEILGAFQKALPAELGAQMQSAMERFTKAKTLAAIVAEMQRLAPAAAPAPVAVNVSVAAPAARIDFAALLTGIVAERTGYPPEMLGMDADLEADLGIDSIKRVEILGAFQKALPAELGAQMQASMERYTKAKTLSAILQALDSLQAPAAAPAAVTVSVAAAPAAKAAAPAAPAAPTPRYVIKSRPAPLPAASSKLGGLAIVLGDSMPVAKLLSAELKSRGMTPVHVSDNDPAKLRAAIAAARAKHGPAKALLQINGLDRRKIGNLADWKARYSLDALSLYHGLKALESDLERARIVGASRFGGTFGRDSVGKGAASGGAANGVFNCLRYEYPQSLMRAVDFDGQSDEDIARLLVDELASDCREPEVGYVGTVRHGSVTSSQPLTASPFPASVVPSGDWVVLVTGGARGITAEIVEELVRPGMRLVLLGRTAAPAPESAETSGHADAAQLKAALLKARMARGEKPKPVEIDREVSRILVDREIRANLAKLTAAGAKVEYLACDVRDEAAFGGLIDSLYAKHGNIDAVLHGAGVIEDKLFVDKTAESFERVLGTKLDAAFLLSQRLKPQNLKLLAFFTSVAGRYGNRGQSDYAAANETLNRLAWQLHREWPQTRVIAVNWGPWDAGMASEGVRRAFKERGIEAIPVPSGRRFFLDEIAYGPRNDVEIVAGAGPWYKPEQEPAEAPAAAPAAQPSGLPLMQVAPRMGPGGNMMMDHQFCVTSDPYLLDHRLDSKGVLPATGALEWMAEFVTAAWPGWQVVEMRDHRVLNSVMLDPEVNGGKRSVQIRARASSHSDLNGQTITVEIIDPAKKLPLYRATAVLAQKMPEPPVMNVEALAGAKPFAATDAYAHFLFHGPRFQLASDIPAVAEGGLDARVRPTLPTEWLPEAQGSWLFDPALCDVAPQMAIVWSRLNRNMTALPSAFASVRRYGSEPLPKTLRLALRLLPAPHESAMVYDALYLDDAGRVRLEMRHCEATMSAALNRLGGQAATIKNQPSDRA
ncbi:type I polyketide synthase [Solimonas sp. SE-A11]|uniref:type I polyketide synthase n=1 Tax=Solimonas sp. SE-A11 TaxID=3054954 RepID=UPI00259CA095|nr:type I polyketide synthase [Solimonas sp. SE-A11]MDM4769636.1 SDR family NAD(P)-dependent oxidoreductase [Solimonas sp. SE-A11]